MEALSGAASHKPFTNQVAGRVTVYVQTSHGSLKPTEVITCKQLITKPATGSVKSQGPLPADADRVASTIGTPIT